MPTTQRPNTVRDSTSCATTTSTTASKKANEMPPKKGADSHEIASPTYCVRESVTTYALPRTASSMPSDTMNEGSRHATEIMPVMVPHTRPVASASAAAAGTVQPHCRMAAAEVAAASAITEPTDKSMPAMMSTKVMPTAITARAGISLAMVMKVSALQKYSDSDENSATMPASTASRPR